MKIDGKEAAINFPSSLKCLQLEELLKIDVFEDLEKIVKPPFPALKNLNTEEKTRQAAEIIFPEGEARGLFTELGRVDQANVIAVFFSGMLKIRVVLNGEIERSKDTVQAKPENGLQEATHSNTPSSTSPTAIQK